MKWLHFTRKRNNFLCRMRLWPIRKSTNIMLSTQGYSVECPPTNICLQWTAVPPAYSSNVILYPAIAWRGRGRKTPTPTLLMLFRYNSKQNCGIKVISPGAFSCINLISCMQLIFDFAGNFRRYSDFSDVTTSDLWLKTGEALIDRKH